MKFIIISLFICGLVFGDEPTHSTPSTDKEPPTSTRPTASPPQDEESDEAQKETRQKELLGNILKAIDKEEKFSLDKLLEEIPDLENAIRESLNGNNSDINSIFERLDLAPLNNEKRSAILAKFLVEKDLSQLFSKYNDMINGSLNNHSLSNAINKEILTLISDNQKTFDIFKQYTGEHAGLLAIRIESWKRSIGSNNYTHAAEEMAGFLRSINSENRQILAREISSSLKENDPFYNALKTATKLASANVPSANVRNRLIGPILSSDESFYEAFRTAWAKELKEIEKYNKLLNAAVTYSDEKYTVDKEALNELRNKFPGLTADWAFFNGDIKSLIAAGYKDNNWQITPALDPATTKSSGYANTTLTLEKENLDKLPELMEGLTTRFNKNINKKKKDEYVMPTLSHLALTATAINGYKENSGTFQLDSLINSLSDLPGPCRDCEKNGQHFIYMLPEISLPISPNWHFQNPQINTQIKTKKNKPKPDNRGCDRCRGCTGCRLD